MALGIILQQCIDKYMDPELIFFGKVANMTDAWFTKVKNNPAPLHIIIGGSEIATSVNPRAMQEKHGITVVNAGNHAGFGLPGNVVAAEHHIAKGNHVVCSLYPAPNITTQGLKFAFRQKGLNMFSTNIIPLNTGNLLTVLSGDLSANVNYVKRQRKRIKRGRPTHGYMNPEKATLHNNGFLEIHNMRMHEMEPEKLYHDEVCAATSDIVEFCKKMQQLCHERGASFSVMFALHYNSLDCRIKHAELARHLTVNGIPVLKDERLGISDDLSYFSDTPSHLSNKGVDICSDIWGYALKNRIYWTEQELTKTINSLGETSK
ncbi:MAG: hypothetical protein IKA55_05325 [Akkermansia sp.]|nr:hypothetical protein [Akkermansia sp.]